MRVHLMIPDVQAKPGIPLDHLRWAGQYIADIRPDVLINIGDFADMESLSLWDVGTRSFEGRRVLADIDASHKAMKALHGPIDAYNDQKRRNKEKLYRPEMHLTLGNHEHRIVRAIEKDAKLDGVLGIPDLDYESYGWTVHEFLKPVELDGINYAHYFYNPNSGRPYAGMVETMLKNIGFTFSMGHQQGKRIGAIERSNGRVDRGLVAGSFYLHDEEYKGHQGNSHWRGLIVKHEVRNGQYDLMEVSIDYLCRKYEGCRVWEFMREKHPETFEASFWLKREMEMDGYTT